jgi:photosystem II stability/assembly factor-like uncharacterized protein
MRPSAICDLIPAMRYKLIFLFLAMTANTAWQWERVPVETAASLRGLSVVDAKIAWASGTNGTVIRTNDGGATWNVETVAGAEKLDFRGIKAFDAEHAVIVSSGDAQAGQATIYKTSDAGKTWNLVLEEKRKGIFFDAIAFWDRQRGLALSDPVDGKFVLFTTQDGGASWKQIPPDQIPPALSKEGAFAASNSCLTVSGKLDAWFGTGGANVARVFHSADGGLSWSVSETPLHPANASTGIFSLAFENQLQGVAVGGDYAHAAASPLPNVLFTADGGKTWTGGVATGAKALYLSSVVYLERSGALSEKKEKEIFAAGSAGTAVLNPGKSWKVDSDFNFNAVAAFDEDTVWAVGPKGAVWRRQKK